MNNFRDKVVYQIYIKSFHDSNGNGIGDLNGITEKLDYLHRLGIDYIWLTPFLVSPQNDNGYDVQNYYEVDEVFGTMEDLERLIIAAEKRKIGLMMDMVFNHTSTSHEWFQKALTGDPAYMDYYIFKDGPPDKPPTNWISKFGGTAWEYVPDLKKWYLHLFDKTQADLNWDNPKVRDELKKVIRFWKRKGVKGFRFDVVNLISKPCIFENDMEGDGRRFYSDGPHVHEYLKELVRDTEITDMVTVGEMSSTSVDNCIRYSNPEEKELSMCFNFHHLKIDYKNGNKWELMPPDTQALFRIWKDWQLGMQQGNGWNATFWCNHDQPRSVSRLGDDQNYWKESAKMLAVTTHLMRGTPYIFQGEELGMPNACFTDISEYRDVESLNYYQIMRDGGKSKAEALEILSARSRDNGRTPMQWTRDQYRGFSIKEPWIPFSKHRQKIAANEQTQEADSIFNFYRSLIQLRKEKAVIAEGTVEFVNVNQPDILVFRRLLGKEEVLVLCNFNNKELTVNLEQDLKEYNYLIGNYNEDIPIAESNVHLRPYETLVTEKSY